MSTNKIEGNEYSVDLDLFYDALSSAHNVLSLEESKTISKQLLNLLARTSKQLHNSNDIISVMQGKMSAEDAKRFMGQREQDCNKLTSDILSTV